MRYQFVDCRWSLDDPGLGRRLYLEAHIPGAAFLDVEQDLSAPPGMPGRHPLPAAGQFAAAASAAGIGAEVQVVAYGTLGGAERLWWLLRHFGHDACAVIDLGAWRGPLRGGEEQVEPQAFVPVERNDRFRHGSLGRREPAHPRAGEVSRTRSTACRGEFRAR